MNKQEKIKQTLLKDIKAGKRISPLKAIKINCIECCGFNVSETRKCPSDDCALWKFRFGKNMTGKNPSKRK